MANLTATEKALKIIVKQIKALDDNALTLDILSCPIALRNVRNHYFEILELNGYNALTRDYKLIKKK